SSSWPASASKRAWTPWASFGVVKRPHPGHRVEFVRQLGVAEAMFVVLAADVQRQAVAGGNHDAGRQDLDQELDRLAGNQRPFLVVRVVGAVRQALLDVELALRGPQPAEANATRASARSP